MKDKASPWYSVPRSQRKKRRIELNFGEEARARLDALSASEGKSRSEVVEGLLLADAKPKKTKPPEG